MSVNKARSRLILKILMLLFAVGFYYFTRSENWILSITCLVLAFVMWFLPRLSDASQPSGLGRTVEEDNRVLQQKKGRDKGGAK